jgi:hypothetical protein
MPLSQSLNLVEMEFRCSECGCGFVKPGRWFKSAAQHRCDGCHHVTHLTYSNKLALFDKYAKLLSMGSVARADAARVSRRGINLFPCSGRGNTPTFDAPPDGRLLP